MSCLVCDSQEPSVLRVVGCRDRPHLAVAPNQIVGRAVVRELRRASALSISGTMRCASALPSSTPHWSKALMFQIDALREDAVLVERDQLAEHRGRQSVGQDRVRRTVALEDAMRHERGGRALGLHLLGGLAERERLGLREDVGQQDVVMPAQRRERVREGDEVARDQPRALMDQLVERVLSVGAGLAPVDRAGLVVDRRRRRA